MVTAKVLGRIMQLTYGAHLSQLMSLLCYYCSSVAGSAHACGCASGECFYCLAAQKEHLTSTCMMHTGAYRSAAFRAKGAAHSRLASRT